MPEALNKQMAADKAQGYDFVGYHGYGKRRYFELVGGECTVNTLIVQCVDLLLRGYHCLVCWCSSALQHYLQLERLG